MSDASVVSLTGPGRAAIHVVLLHGPDSPSILDQVFRGQGISPHGVVFGAEDEVIDDAILLEWPGSEPRYLLTLHGSPFIRDRVIARFVDLGAKHVDSVDGLWALDDDGFRNVIRSEALQFLSNTISNEASRFLLEQASGDGFSGWFEQSLSHPIDLDELDQMLLRAPVGIGMLKAARVVLAGPPNAGKSTLFNLLYGSQRVLTSEQPGTTRDLIEGEVCFGGFPVQLVDGAGLRDSSEEIEREGIRRMKKAMEQADLVVYLVPPGQLELHPGQHGTPVDRTLVVHSRRDEDQATEAVGRFAISSITGEGIDALQEGILEQLYGRDRDLAGLRCPFFPAHVDLLVDIRSVVNSGGDPAPVIRQYGASQLGGIL